MNAVKGLTGADSFDVCDVDCNRGNFTRRLSAVYLLITFQDSKISTQLRRCVDEEYSNGSPTYHIWYIDCLQHFEWNKQNDSNLEILDGFHR